MFKLKVILASTRENRKGPAIADWFMKIVAEHKDVFQTELIDLKEVDLPLLDEPNHPRLSNYTHEHTKRWSKIIDDADAYIFITCEYNYSFPASLKNAIDYLHNEWKYKPVTFVSYGGIAAGTRAVQMLKQVVTTLSMMPIFESVNIPFFAQYINEQGVFESTEKIDKSAHTMIQALAPWTEALKEMREKLVVQN